jgi:hypothetical protein
MSTGGRRRRRKDAKAKAETQQRSRRTPAKEEEEEAEPREELPEVRKWTKKWVSVGHLKLYKWVPRTASPPLPHRLPLARFSHLNGRLFAR